MMEHIHSIENKGINMKQDRLLKTFAAGMLFGIALDTTLAQIQDHV